MRRRGFTLIEVLIAVVVGAVILIVVTRLLVSGSRLFFSGMKAARGPEAAILLMNRLERDMYQCLQVPGDPRRPMVVREGKEIAFYIPGAVGRFSNPETVVGVPVRWSLKASETSYGLFHPVRNDEVLTGIVLKDWKIVLWDPDTEEDRPGWYLTIRAEFPTDGFRGKPYIFSRALFLAQPSKNYLHYYPYHGKKILPGSVRLLPSPSFHSSLFAGVAPVQRSDELRDGLPSRPTHSKDAALTPKVVLAPKRRPEEAPPQSSRAPGGN